MVTAVNVHRSMMERGSRISRATIGLWLLIVAMGLAGCSAGAAPPSPAPQGGLMVAPNAPGVWYAGDFVSLDEAAAKVPFVILLPDEAVVGAELVSVELNHPETVMAVALHYANDVVVSQSLNPGIESLPTTLQEAEQVVQVAGIPAIGKEAGHTESQITGGKVPYPATVVWYVDGVLRVVTYADRDDMTLEELLQIAESMKAYTPFAQ